MIVWYCDVPHFWQVIIIITMIVTIISGQGKRGPTPLFTMIIATSFPVLFPYFICVVPNG